MKQQAINTPTIYTLMVFCILLMGLLFSTYSHAYFIGYHSGGMQKNNAANSNALFSEQRVHYSPRYHYKGAYKSSWTTRGPSCKKTCVLDRWTGNALSCYKTC